MALLDEWSESSAWHPRLTAALVSFGSASQTKALPISGAVPDESPDGVLQVRDRLEDTAPYPMAGGELTGRGCPARDLIEIYCFGRSEPIGPSSVRGTVLSICRPFRSNSPIILSFSAALARSSGVLVSTAGVGT